MLANQPKNDTLYIKGFNIVVENRAFTYRQVAQNVGQKVCLMPAHYGYLQNNPKVGVFVGAFPENDTVYLINQKAQGGYFDKHIAMFGFLSEEQAVDTYQKCFEYGYIGLMSVIPCTIEQLKWWLINGDKSRPVTKERLPYAGLERLDSVLWGGEDQADLASHSGQVAKLLYQIRQSDNFNHALEPLSYHDLTQELGNQGFVYENYDALVIEYNKLERKAKQMLMAMQGAADVVKPVGVAVSKPLTKGGVANVVAWFEMEDGQAVGVFFHNPDKTPKKIDPTDEMISYKWVLNKKDITIVVAPENGKDLVIRTVAKRIMKLVDANHDRFLKANSAKAELNLKEQDLNAQVIAKQSQLDMLNKDIELLEAQKAEKEAQPSGEQLLNTGYDGIKAELKGMAWVDDPIVQGGLVKSFIGAQESGDTNPDGILSISINRNGVNIAAKVGADTIIPNSVELIPQYGIDAQSTQNYKKVADKINNAVEDYVAKRRKAVNTVAVPPVVEPEHVSTLQSQQTNSTTERPADYRTNLANARAVAKSLGIETKGKKLNTLLKEIDVFDEKEVKKELLAEFKDLASRLVLPKGYVFDLTDAEKSIDNAGYLSLSAWIKKQGKIDTKTIRIELRAIPDSSQDVIFSSVHFYTDDKDTKKELDKLNYQNFDSIGRSEAITPKAIVEKMEQFLTKAVFPKIEYLRFVNSTSVDVSKLADIGIAEITDIGNENIYIEKDGKGYFSKVGNTESYALGEWDFAKYPEGKPAELVTQPEPTPVVPEPTPATVQAESTDDGYMMASNGAQYKFEIRPYNNGFGVFVKSKHADGREFDQLYASRKTEEDAQMSVNQAKNLYLDIPLPSGNYMKGTFNGKKYEGLSESTAKIEAKKRNNGIDAGSEWVVVEDSSNKGKFAIELRQEIKAEQPVSEPPKPLSDIVIKALLSQDSEAWYADDYGDVKRIYSADERDGFFIRISDKSKQVDLTYADWETGQKQHETFVADTISPDQVIDRIKAFITKYEQNSVELSPVQPISEPPMTNPDRDYLQSIIDGDVDPLTVDIDAVIALAEKYDGDAEMTPLLDQALEAINQAEQEAAKGI